MPDAFVLFGKLEIGTTEFDNALKKSESSLKSTRAEVDRTENAAKNLGQTSAATGRGFDKMREAISQAQGRLSATTEAFRKGEASQSQMRSAMLGVERAAQSLNLGTLPPECKIFSGKLKMPPRKLRRNLKPRRERSSTMLKKRQKKQDSHSAKNLRRRILETSARKLLLLLAHKLHRFQHESQPLPKSLGIGSRLC